jgi:hypothetical protein
MKTYLMKLPGKPDKIIENIIYEKLLPQVEKLGGTLVLIEEDEEVKIPLTRTETLLGDLGL